MTNDCMIGERPMFLDRYTGDTGYHTTTKRQRKTWRMSASQKLSAQKSARKRERIAARPTVYAAVKAGNDTAFAIRTATGLDPSFIRSALHFYIHTSRSIDKVGRRYFIVTGRRP